jgi:hypothetical protein
MPAASDSVGSPSSLRGSAQQVRDLDRGMARQDMGEAKMLTCIALRVGHADSPPCCPAAWRNIPAVLQLSATRGRLAPLLGRCGRRSPVEACEHREGGATCDWPISTKLAEFGHRSGYFGPASLLLVISGLTLYGCSHCRGLTGYRGGGYSFPAPRAATRDAPSNVISLSVIQLDDDRSRLAIF